MILSKDVIRPVRQNVGPTLGSASGQGKPRTYNRRIFMGAKSLCIALALHSPAALPGIFAEFHASETNGLNFTDGMTLPALAAKIVHP